MDDVADLVCQLRADPDNGVKVLEIEYKTRLMAFAMRLGVDSSEAEALVWRTFEEALKSIDSYVEKEAFFGWLCKIMVNCRGKDTRRKSVQRIVYRAETPDFDDDGTDSERVAVAVDAAILRDAIEQLPKDMREAIILHYFLGEPILKVAKILLVPVGTVKSRLFYARTLLAKRLNGRGIRRIASIGLALAAATGLAATMALTSGVFDFDDSSKEKTEMNARQMAVATALVALNAQAVDLSYTKWVGSSGGAWSGETNWSAGLPAADKAADFSDVGGSGYFVDVPEDVTVGGLRFGEGAVTLRGEGKITFARTGADAAIEVAAGGDAVVSNALAGAGNLVKSGAGTLGALIQNFTYAGRTIIREGTLHPLYGGIQYGEYWLGQGAEGLLVLTNGVIELTYSNLLANEMPITLDGGQFLQGGHEEYIGKLTMRHGARLYGKTTLYVYDDSPAHICADGGGYAGQILTALAVCTPNGPYGKDIFDRTQEIDVAAGTTLEFAGRVNDVGRANNAKYKGNVRKTGEGTLLVNECSSASAANAARGAFTAVGGDVVFSNKNTFTCLTLNVMPGSGGRFSFAKGAETSFGGLTVAANERLDLNGTTFTIGGEAESGGTWQGTVVNGKVVKAGANTTRIAAALDEVAPIEVAGGKLVIDAGEPFEPLVCWTFDDEVSPGLDLGSLGRNLVVESEHRHVVQDEERGAVLCFDGRDSNCSVSAAGLPSSTAFTILGWMKSKSQNSGLLYWGPNQSVKSGGFGIQANAPKFYFYGGGDLSAPASAVYSDGKTWTHYACVYDPSAAPGTKMRIYVNGSLVAQMDNTQPVAIDLSSPLYLGQVTQNSDRHCDGFVDDVMICGKALTEAEIAVVMARKNRARQGDEYLPPATDVRTVRGGTLSVCISNQTLQALSGDGTVEVADRATATFATSGSLAAGTVSGAGRAVKTGAGTLTLTRAVNLARSVEVEAGDLVLDGPFSPFGHHVVRYAFEGDDLGADAGPAGLSLTPAEGTWDDFRDPAVPGAVWFDGAHALVPTAAGQSLTGVLPHGNASWTVAIRFTLDARAGNRSGFYSWGNTATRQINAARLFDAGDQQAAQTGVLHFNWADDLHVGQDLAAWRGTPADGWHELVVTYEGGNRLKRMFFDGTEIGSQTVSADLNVAAANFTIGRSARNGGHDYFRGYLDEFMVLDCAVAPELVGRLFPPDDTASASRLKVAEGARASVALGAVQVGGVDLRGTLNVGGDLHLRQGASAVKGNLTGSGTVVVRDGASLALDGEKDFEGTVWVANGSLCGDWRVAAAAIRVDADGTLRADGPVACLAKSYQLASAASVVLGVPDEGIRGVYWTSAESLALPSALDVQLETASMKPASSKVTLFSAPSLVGDISGWTFDQSKLSDEGKFGKSTTRAWFSWGKRGFIMIVH